MRQNNANADIRAAIAAAGLRQWEVARLIGVSENTLIRWMRYEMPEEKKRMIADAIWKEVKRRERDN